MYIGIKVELSEHQDAYYVVLHVLYMYIEAQHCSEGLDSQYSQLHCALVLSEI